MFLFQTRTSILPQEPNETWMHDDYNATAITRTKLTAENFRLEGWTKETDIFWY